MTDRPVAMHPCGECGMPCDPREYHPYAACLMFKACHNSETVRANLDAVRRAQPAPAASREPLTIAEVEQLLAQWSYELHGDRARYLVRMTERHHGLTKGA